MDHLTSWLLSTSHHTSLSLVGLLALADLDIVGRRTILTGTSTWLDSLILCPGLHRQHAASQLSNGEYPACAAMTTGYVFRVENPATVSYLQSVGETGKLTTLSVSQPDNQSLSELDTSHLAAALTVMIMAWLASIGDWSALSYLLVLSSVRLITMVVICSQAYAGWHGLSEPNQLGDLFILLSYDRWVRIHGEVDDLKAVTSGRWLRKPTIIENTMTGCATLLAYIAPTIAATATWQGQAAIAITLTANAALLGLVNHTTTTLHMKGRVLRMDGDRKAYKSRNILASELVSKSKRVDWALAMGLIPSGLQSPTASPTVSNRQGPVMM